MLYKAKLNSYNGIKLNGNYTLEIKL